MADEIKDIRGYYKWVQKCKAEFAALNEAWTTTKQKFADEWWAIHERRENKGLVLPKDVEADRRRNDDLHLNDSLHQIDAKLARITQRNESVDKTRKDRESVIKRGVMQIIKGFWGE